MRFPLDMKRFLQKRTKGNTDPLSSATRERCLTPTEPLAPCPPDSESLLSSYDQPFGGWGSRMTPSLLSGLSLPGRKPLQVGVISVPA